ncbi:iron chelate uptake ABC transporter family permease subunit [Microbacterium awajiense]|uniref:Iron chelate uptake ABC transporter family permease subunit n=1 Tax=Microbacterium awajiense TaxID=415214 RepID=A0ABP7A388_9MICO
MTALAPPTTAHGAVAEVRLHTRRRSLLATAAATGGLLAAFAIAMLVGDYALEPWAVVRALFGDGSRIDVFVVNQVRLPRAAMAVLCGLALGIAGALFQTLLRNPLASPDLLGVSGGASVAAVWTTLILGLSGAAVAASAFVGGMLVAAVLLLAARRLADGGYRLVLAGVGIAFLCSAVIGYLIKRAQVTQAQSALVWITGSIGATPWTDVVVVAAVLLLVAPAVWAATRLLPIVELGDPLASGLGVRPVAVRIGVVVVAVLLAAASTAFIGPVGFVALCAPPIARALLGRGASGIAVSGVFGAVILLVSDLIAQYAIPGVAVPVGVVTGLVGAPYLLWLLATSKGHRW